MNRVARLVSFSLFACLGATFAEEHVSSESPSKPNIVVFMVDDLGWNHISVGQVTQGTSDPIYQTPHLERLANGGLSFTSAYAQPNCAPTRAAMLTGQYPARVNNDVYVVGHLNRYGNGGLTEEEARFRGPEQSEFVAANAVTVAEALRENGYATAHIGKYHVGGHNGPETMPENAGFDINIGGYSQGNQATCFASRIDGSWKFRNTGLGRFDKYAEPYDESYVKRRGLPDSLVGTKKHISDALGDALEQTIRGLASGKQPFYLQFHTYAVHGPVQARPDLQASVANRFENADEKLVEYAAFVASVDENVKRLLDCLDDPNGDGDRSDSITANTLVLFTSDNGGTHAPNTPLKGVKGMIAEGGIRVPLIAYWPGVVPANSTTDYKTHSVDYYPSYLELAGGGWMPDPLEHPLDGESFVDVLFDPNTNRQRGPIFYLFPGYMDWRAEPFVSVIDDIGGQRFKLNYFYETDSWELYDLDQDQSEESNRIDRLPEVASTLAKKIDQWLRQSHPTWNPKYPKDKDSGMSVGPPGLLP